VSRSAHSPIIILISLSPKHGVVRYNNKDLHIVGGGDQECHHERDVLKLLAHAPQPMQIEQQRLRAGVSTREHTTERNRLCGGGLRLRLLLPWFGLLFRLRNGLQPLGDRPPRPSGHRAAPPTSRRRSRRRSGLLLAPSCRRRVRKHKPQHRSRMHLDKVLGVTLGQALQRGDLVRVHRLIEPEPDPASDALEREGALIELVQYTNAV
jgi:hypothetical protein